MLGFVQVTVHYVEVGIATSVLVLGVGIVFVDCHVSP